ncbi:TM2 domain-containing protein [Paenalcaligenes faecalis]|uniref:TM2 domain-containing protein n=1 Tax=Paenalcaligenes faecalis TaxID=2980099 RepID=UPI0022B97410|nr:TM2 domain-containing protein [Paenalcaligenes faecalis]
MRNIALAIGVFVVLLVALSFGEKLGTELFSWISSFTGWAFHNLQDVTLAVQHYIAMNWAKVLIALLLTLPISYWISQRHTSEEAGHSRQNRRKIAIFLAFFLGWLGAHRFYVGQIGWGLFYLILFYIFAPLVILVSWIDALRYLLMSDEDFALRL